MSTAQSNDSIESQATPIEPTGAITPQTATNADDSAFGTDQRSDMVSLISVQRKLLREYERTIQLQDLKIKQLEEIARLAAEDSVMIYYDVYEVQERLLDLVDDYLQTVSPVSAINTLLEHWLSTPPTQLSAEKNSKQVHVMLALVNFLVSLKDCDDALKLVTNARKEGNNG